MFSKQLGKVGTWGEFHLDVHADLSMTPFPPMFLHQSKHFQAWKGSGKHNLKVWHKDLRACENKEAQAEEKE